MPLNKYDEFYEQYMPELTRRLSEFPNWVQSIPNHRQGKPYIAYSAGKSGIQYYSEYTSRGYIGGNNKGFIVGIYIDGADYKQKLDYFKQFEPILDNSLVWLDTGKAGRIFYKLSGLFENKSEWANVITWQIDKLIKTMNEFKPYITEFNPNVKIRTKNRQLKKEVEVINKISLNQILYGPPGTGKTYNTINKALKIIDGEVPEDRNEAKSRFEELQKAGQIEFVTFHQSYGYEEFVEGIKAQSLDGEISYDVEGGAFKKLCEKAETNYFNAHETKRQKRNFEEVFKSEVLDKLVAKLKIEMPRTYYYITEVNEKTIFFEKADGGTAHSLSIRTLKRMYENGKNNIIRGGLSVYYEPLLNVLLQNSDKKETQIEDLKNHIIIIDEINRGNISKIFGELITLIEPSKRICAEEEIRVRLPYSNDEFGVPSNLYIIGTMNTADRSIALLDTALRRRFEFVEMMPNAGLLDFSVGGINISKLLQKINARVEYLYDREHTIGHAYFMELNASSSLEDLNAIMKNKIIPLLQEYFYDDWEKILLVLNDGFIQRTSQNIKTIFDTINDEYIEEDKFLYSVKSEFSQEAYLKIYDKISKSEEE